MNGYNRFRYASRLAVAHRENPSLRPLILKLLETALLEDEIPVQKDGMDIDEFMEWDVVSYVGSTKLRVPQTNACKSLSTRTFGIAMAMAIKDREILEQIAAHPSLTMKAQVKAALAKIKEKPMVVDDAKNMEFTEYFNAIKDAPEIAPHGPNDVKNRTHIWGNYLEYKKLPWSNGSLTSILDLRSRRFVAEGLLDLMLSHPPTTTSHTPPSPFLPYLIRKNLKELLKIDPVKTIAVFATTIIGCKNENVKYQKFDSLRVIFRKKLRFWCQSGVDLIPLIKPLADKVELTTVSGGSAIVYGNHVHLNEILAADPPFYVLDFLAGEALTVFDNWFRKALKDASNNSTDSVRKELQSGAENTTKYVTAIMKFMLERVIAVSRIESKDNLLRTLEKKFETTIERLFTVVDSMFELSEKALLFQHHEIDTISWRLESLTNRLLRLIRSHGPLSMTVFNRSRKYFEIAGALSDSLLENHLSTLLLIFQPPVETVFGYRRFCLKSPYSGIRSISNEEIVRFAESLLPSPDFWVFQAKRLTSDNKQSVKYMFTFEVVCEWIIKPERVENLFSYLDNFVVKLEDRSELAEILLEKCKEFEIKGSFRDRVEKELRLRLDIRKPAVRKLLVDRLRQTDFELRIAAIKQLVHVTVSCQSIEETIRTFSVLLPLIRLKRIGDVVDSYCKFLGTMHSWKEFLAMKGLQIIFLQRVYTQMQRWMKELNLQQYIIRLISMQLLAAVSAHAPAKDFINTIANNCVQFYSGNPDHPLFQLGLDIFWRHAVYLRGVLAGSSFYLRLSNPPIDYVDEVLEIKRRQSDIKGLELLKGCGVVTKSVPDPMETFGLFLVDEGFENEFVSKIVENIKSKFYKLAADTEKNGCDFNDSMIKKSLCCQLVTALAYRWSRCSFLVDHFEVCLKVLENAKTSDNLPDNILDWTSSDCADALEFVDLAVKFSGSELKKRFSELSLKSTEAEHELKMRFKECKNKNADVQALVTQAMALSPGGSALASPDVMQFTLSRRPDLLKEEHFSPNASFAGLFNRTASKPELSLRNTRKFNPLPAYFLLPWQGELLTNIYKKKALDKTLPMPNRILATSRMMHMKNVSVNDAAAFLTQSSLPSRIKEAVLMFLPRLDEPGSTINLLINPAFLDSDVARTAIFAVKNAAKHLPKDILLDVLEDLVPSENAPVKVAVFKEVTRLLVDFAYEPRILSIIENIWQRPNLHSDVRVSLLQRNMSLLGDENPEIQALAWKIVSDVAVKHFVKCSHVLLKVVVKPVHKFYDAPNLISHWPVSEGPSLYSNLADANISPKIVCKYGVEVLAPLTRCLYFYVKGLSEKSETSEDLFRRVNYAIRILLDYGFIATENAKEIASILEDVLVDASLSVEGSEASSQHLDNVYQLFGKLQANAKPNHAYIQASLGSPKFPSIKSEVSAVGPSVFHNLFIVFVCCTGLQVAAPDSPIPESWNMIIRSVFYCGALVLNPECSPDQRNSGYSRLNSMGLGRYLIPGPKVLSSAFLNNALAVVDVLDALPRGFWHFKDLKWSRRAALVSTRANAVTQYRSEKHADNAECADIMKEAESLMVDLLWNVHSKAQFGQMEVDDSVWAANLGILSSLGNVRGFDELLEKVLTSDEWCSKIPGFSDFRPMFNSELIMKFDTFFSNPEYAEKFCRFALDLLDLKNRWLPMIIPELIKKIIEISEASKKLKKENLRFLSALVIRIAELVEESGYSKESYLTSWFLKLVDSNVIWLLQLCPSAISKFIAHDLTSDAFKTWVHYLDNEKKDKATRDDPVCGIAGVSLLLQKLYDAVEDAKFDRKIATTKAFVDLFSNHLSLVARCCPKAVDAFIVKDPSSPVGLSFIKHISTSFGTETACMYLHCVADGYLEYLDLVSFLVSKTSRPAKNRTSGFVLELEEEWNAIRNAEKRASFATVRGVCAEFAMKWEKSPVTKEYLHAIRNQSSLSEASVLPLPFAQFLKSLPTIGLKERIEKTPEIKILDLLLDSITIDRVIVDPRLFFSVVVHRLYQESVNPVGKPFDLPRKYEQKFKLLKMSEATKLSKPSRWDGNDINNAIPLKFYIDVARTFAHEVAPCFDAVHNRMGNSVRRIAIDILVDVQTFTANCCFAQGRKFSKETKSMIARVTDVLVWEAAEPDESKTGGMVVKGWAELMDDLMFAGDRTVFDIARKARASSWQLRWTV
ncbi:hypothetical protein HDU83_007224 [Entophlyctis luteolus]|nr:hypothetical protein HDU83_007224 [Entophlyctis luteolus]